MIGPSRWKALGLAVVLALACAIALSAHEVTYQGTVLSVEATRVQVRTVDQTSKRAQDMWFAVNQKTKVKRGTKTVALADAAISKDERIVVIVDHDAETKMLATEIRLAARK